MIQSLPLNKTKEDSMAVVTFRNFANQLRQPSSYFPMVTELKGAANLFIGSLQFLISYYMKYSRSSYYNSLSAKHYEIGTQAVRQGAIEFVPGALASFGAAYAARIYNVTATDIVEYFR
jgi:hypothetical protein